MSRTKYGNWIKTGQYSYVEGRYYKVNRALFLRKGKNKKYAIILRNTWTGKEKELGEVNTKSKALKIMRSFMVKNRVY